MKILFFCLLLICPFLVNGQSVIVTENSAETLEWAKKLILEAKQTIELCSYSPGGELWCELLTTMDRRLEVQDTLQVSILISPVLITEKESDLLEYLGQKYPGRVRAMMTTAHFTAIPDYCTNEHHMKILIIDEEYFIVGGTNFHEALCTTGTDENKVVMANSLYPSGTRDMDIVGKGETAIELRKLFYDLYALWKSYAVTGQFVGGLEKFRDKSRYYPIDEKFVCSLASFDSSPRRVEVDKIKVIYGTPFCTSNAITREYERLIHDAKKEIVISNFFFNPVPSIFSEIKEALKREVDLSLITNGLWEGSSFYCTLFCWGNRVNYVPLFYGRDFSFWEPFCDESREYNAHIFEYQVKNIVYHKKVMVVDRKYSLIGSYNLNVKSDHADFEVVLVIDSKKVAEDILQVLEFDKKLSVKVTPEQARGWYFDPFTSYHGALQKLFQGFL